jgi:hypothetical protein
MRALPTEAEVLTKLVAWADAVRAVRALLLTSSRARPGGPVDALSDYDLILAVTDSGTTPWEQIMRRKYTMRNATALGIGCLLATLLAGCGGGNTSIPAGTGTLGKATFTVVWPVARGRLIPVASNSILVQITSGAKTIASQTLPRPASGGNATVTFDPLPTGDFMATATAYPQINGTGVAQATASIPLTIHAGATTSFTLTMASTIQKLSVTAPFPTLEARLSEALAATALDTNGNVVLTLPATIQWSSSDNTVATVDTTGKLTAVNAGTVQITAREIESGQQGTLSVTVSPAGTLLVYDGFDYPAGQGLANQTGGTGWLGAWNQYGQGDTPSVITSSSLSYGTLLTTGNAVQTTSDNPTGHARTLAQTYGQSGTQLYFSLLVRAIDPFTQQDPYFGFEINGQIFVGKGGSKPNFCLEHDGGSGHIDSNVPAQPNTTYFLVVRVTFKDGPDTIDLFVNPPVGQPLTAVPDVTKSDEDLGMINGFLLGGAVRAQYDEVRIGTSYGAVSPTR